MPPLRNLGQPSEAERPEYAGQYRLEACLGTGGMGVVHLAASESGLRLAVKVIHAEHASDPEFRARFRQEVAAARRVSGAFTASVVDADPEAGRPWMATLFIDGPTLSERVKRNPLEGAELRRMGAGLAEALRDIHRAGVVHRDLKPSNVLLAADGPKVIDFGISRPTDSDLRTETGKLIGTPPFMAPEQFQRPREVGPAADVFALGSVLVHAATGRGPFDSDSPYIVAYQVVHDEPDLTGVPADLVPLLRRCLEKDPALRPTPYEVMVALREATSSAAYDTQAHIPVPRTPDPVESLPGADDAVGGAAGGGRRRVRWAVAVAGAVAVALAVTGFLALGGPDGGGDPGPARSSERPVFTGWSAELHRGGGENRTAECAAGPAGLFCASPGITAARLDPATGRVLWSLPAGGARGGAPDRGDLAMTPVLAGGLLHVVAPGGGRLTALDPATGTVRWDTGRVSYASVGHIGDLVVLTGKDGRTRAVDAATGRERWARPSEGVGAQWVSAPGAEGAGLPALTWALSADGGSTRITAVDRDGGRTLWTERLTGNLRPAQLSQGALYLLSTDRDGYTDAVVRLAVRGRTAGGAVGTAGAVKRFPVTAPVDQGQAAVAGDTVYVSGTGGTGSVLALDARTGEQRWRRETMASHLSRPVPAGGTVYVSAGDGRLLALDTRRGAPAGQTKPRMDGGEHTFSARLPAPVVRDGRVYGTAPDGSVFALDAGRPARW
ncbi:serine/threonine-protein kinase [Streptomyces yaizuensis]|uniref:Serine/threonine-protein kinase n=1 Tax=Streptomyces yaizuensis TaxID=2989713 RepID=A0ABQ5P0S3_9ACTN|nr:serine/threonine-protein kinase [Streptomyces sp. YSPA8]GLF96114.1 serine/threonine-protein kinase [Streptomyces sp. YSPA8]